MDVRLHSDSVPPRASRFNSNSELDSGSWPTIAWNRPRSCAFPTEP